METISKELRKMSLQLAYQCQDGNLQSVFSCIELVWAIYDKVMEWSIEQAQDMERDYFIISKGQATLALFPVLLKKGLFTWEEMSDIGKFDSKFCIQTDATKFQGGIENSAGSLGHGMPFAAGLAMAAKIQHLPSRVFVLSGDGEFCEGTMWESCIFASAKKLDNLYVVIDDNRSVGSMVDMGDFHAKLVSFGFEVCEVDGHDIEAIACAFQRMDRANGKPKAILAKTVRGYGSETMVKNDIWFHKAPTKEELAMLIEEVDKFCEGHS